MTEHFVKELQNKFLGKRISVEWVNDSENKVIKDGTIVVGVCTSIGPNTLLPSWGLQVTIDRLPVSNVDYKKIRLV